MDKLKNELRPAYMLYPGLLPMLMMNYWIKRTTTPIVAIFVSDYDVKHKGYVLNFFEFLYELIKRSGVRYTLYILLIAKFAVPIVKLWNFTRRLLGKPIKIKTFDEIAKERGIPIFRSKDFNGPETHEFLKNVNANIIVSSYNNQILRKETFNLPQHKAVNIHSALLPNFRGLDPPFEAMYHSVKAAGVTIHYVDSKIDTGEIIVQGPVRIRSSDTLFSLTTRCWMHGAKLLEQVFRKLRNGTLESYKQNPKDIKYPYQSFPDVPRIKEFHARGKKLITWRDIKNTFKT